MTELLIILVLASFCYFYVNRKSPPPVIIQPAKPDIIEDSSHIKQQLAQSQQSYSSSLNLIGQLQYQLNTKEKVIDTLLNSEHELKQKFEKLQHQNKSSQVRTGALTEALLPLSEDFPVDPKTMRFLGSPIDYVAFEYDKDMITFVEVKSGESQLNDNQRRVKKMVEEGKVQFKVVRLNEKGIKVK